MNDPFSLAGRRFLVTGGTRGIGRAITVRFARAGASVVANFVRNLEEAQKLEALAGEEGLDVVLCRADLTTPKGLDQLRETVGTGDPRVFGVVHCAATGVHRPFPELTLRHFDWTFSLNVRAFFDLVQRFRDTFSEGSSIVAVSSEGALRAVPYYSMVGASKGALESLARHLAAEMAPRGVRVNILAPGTVLTDAWESMPDGEERIRQATSRLPLKRLVTPEEVALAAQFLCSEAARGMVGHRLVVDGGEGIVQ